MFKRLLKLRRAREVIQRPSIPLGQGLYAIGDIHGRLDLLNSILDIIRDDHENRGDADTLLLFLGDFVDRGPDSKGVIDRLIRLQESDVPSVFLLGNHDEVFFKAIQGDVSALRFLIKIGGKETILSYGVPKDDYDRMSFVDLSNLMLKLVPESHVQFFLSCQNYLELGDYLFVHAGIRPRRVIDEQTASDLRWIRSEFLNYDGSHGKVVVHGHSISDDIDVRPNRIGLDTGAFASGRLSAIGIEGDERWFLAARGCPDARWRLRSSPEEK